MNTSPPTEPLTDDEREKILERFSELQNEAVEISYTMKIGSQILRSRDQGFALEGMRRNMEAVIRAISELSETYPKIYHNFLVNQLISSAKGALESQNPGKMVTTLRWGLEQAMDLGFAAIAHPEEAEEIYGQIQAGEKPFHHFIYFDRTTFVFPHFGEKRVVQAVFYSLYNIRKKLADMKKQNKRPA